MYVKFRLMKKSILLTLFILGNVASGVVLSPATVQLQEGPSFDREADFALSIDIFDLDYTNGGSFNIGIKQVAGHYLGTFEFGDFTT